MGYKTSDEQLLLSEIREAFSALGGVQRSATITKWVGKRHPNRWQHKMVGSYLRRSSVNHEGAIRRYPGYDHFLFSPGRGEFQIYDAGTHGSSESLENTVGKTCGESDFVEDLEEIADELEIKREFAYEAHLRDYLARNLGILEQGLLLWSGSVADSIEFPIEGRRIDILAKDRFGIPVIIELKLSRGHERTIGQALYYRGKLKQLLEVPRVRIIMVAGEITDELKIASREITDVDVFSYKLTMQVQKVDLSTC